MNIIERYEDPLKAKGAFALTHAGQLKLQEGLGWLDKNRLQAANPEKLPKNAVVVNTAWMSRGDWENRLAHRQAWLAKKKRVNLLALGDVGSTVLIGLKLLGGECISKIGICDLDEKVCKRWESELNQVSYPWEYDKLPKVKIVNHDNLFDCDMFVFCASKGIPPVGSQVKDVRMEQFEANKGLVSNFAKMARHQNYKGLFCVVSDPVDPLCKAALLSSNEGEDGSFDGKGLLPEQIQGYGLGVMNARAAYYAKQNPAFAQFLTQGRSFGPHGQDLVIADSIVDYNDETSKALTKLTVEANLRTRELGFKPYVAPALSSAAISLVLTMEGKWHYSSNFLGGVYMGSKNRFGENGLQIEHLPLHPALYARLEQAFSGLEAII